MATRFTRNDFKPEGIFWHFEFTSKCTLRCPSCSRTVPRVDYEPRDLSRDAIEGFFTDEVLRQTRKVIYSGNLGDPIYHRELPAIVRFFRAAGIHQAVVTNGSWRGPRWWGELADAMAPSDVIIFSIDGLRDTNAIYRINSNWDGIMEAVGVCRGRVKLHWKFIAFAHNEHQIEEARALSKELGFDRFMVVVSWRAKNENMAPKRATLEKIARGADLRPLDGIEATPELRPKCLNGDHWFISHEGRFFPCCMMAAIRHHMEPTVFHRRRERFDITRHGLGEMLASEAFAEFVDTLNDPAKTYQVCREKCASTGTTNRTIKLDAAAPAGATKAAAR